MTVLDHLFDVIRTVRVDIATAPVQLTPTALDKSPEIPILNRYRRFESKSIWVYPDAVWVIVVVDALRLLKSSANVESDRNH